MKSIYLRIRVEPKEHRILKAICRAEGRTLSDVLRRLIPKTTPVPR